MKHPSLVRPQRVALIQFAATSVLALLLLASMAPTATAAGKRAAKAPKIVTGAVVVGEGGELTLGVRCAPRPPGPCRGVAWVSFNGLRSAPASYSLRAGRGADLAFLLRPRQIRALPSAGSVRAALLARSGKSPARRIAWLRLRVTPVEPEPGEDGLPAPLPAGIPDSDAFANRRWAPTAYDTCPESLHDRFAVIGPDGKRYPTWHPPTIVDPATGQRCSFGHEHGADPEESDIFDWVSGHLASPDHPEFAGIPFGYANERLKEFSEAPGNESTPTRYEDHVGHKIDFVNDVTLVDDRGATVFTGQGKDRRPVTCDYLYKLHQGTHSLDATTNNVHELIYATRCDDGTELISTAFARFGSPGEFNRSCHPYGKVETTPTAEFPSGGGERRIADRSCVERDVLVKNTGTTTPWAIYETWESENVLETSTGHRLAYFDPDFAVFDPSRYRDPAATSTNGLARMLDLSWEVTADLRRANADPWTRATDLEPFGFADPRSPFSGSRREFFLKETTVQNADGPRLWWTDPWGENGSLEPFPGAICQLIGQTDNSDRRPLGQRLFSGDGRDYGGDGVHAPN